MDYKLTEGNQSNYQVTLTISPEDMKGYKEKALKKFQKEMDVPGFRKGNVPLDMVEEKVSKEYITMGQLEEAVHDGTKELLEEHDDIKFIGSIYDLNKEEKGDNMIVTFKLDVYPEVDVQNDKWKSADLEELDTEATDEEIEEAVNNIRKQYAEYEPAEKVTEETLTKVKFEHTDKEGNKIDDGTVFLGPEEFDEFDELQPLFVGKKQGETFEIPYEQSGLPPMLHNREDDKEAETIAFELIDIRTTKLPELTEENIKKFFGNDEVKTEEELREKVKELINNQKEESALMQAVDKYLQEVKESFGIAIPKTLIEEEMKSRMKSLQERMGGEEGFNKYLDKIGEEEQKKMMNEIRTAAQQSLEKFFLLRYIVEELNIEEPDWNKPLDVEKKLYKKLAD